MEIFPVNLNLKNPVEIFFPEEAIKNSNIKM